MQCCNFASITDEGIHSPILRCRQNKGRGGRADDDSGNTHDLEVNLTNSTPFFDLSFRLQERRKKARMR
jgi:hypothetical protein